MDLPVSELPNRAGRLIAEIERGRIVVLTMAGRPVADVVPRGQRRERRPTAELLVDLAAISDHAERLAVVTDAGDYEARVTTDDL